MTTTNQRLPVRRHPPPDPGEHIHIATFEALALRGLSHFWSRF